MKASVFQWNSPVAKLHPVRLSLKARKLKLGVLKRKFKVPNDFNAPLPEFESAFYGSPPGKPLQKK